MSKPQPTADPAEPESRASWLAWPGLVGVPLTALLLAWHSLGDLDIWLHWRVGRDLLDGQGLTFVNRYAFTEPGHVWLNHEWLFQILAVLTGPADPAVDPSVLGWNLLRAILATTLVAILTCGDGGLALWRRGCAAGAWRGVFLLMGLGLLWPRLTLRPELLSYLFLVLLVRWVEQALRPTSAASHEIPAGWRAALDPRGPRGRIVWLTLLWVQCHGFAAIAPVIVILAGISAYVEARLKREPASASILRTSGGLLVLVLLALAVSPNGWRGLVFPLQALGQFNSDQVDLRGVISELAPLTRTGNSLGMTIGLFKLSVVWSVLWCLIGWRSVGLLRVLLFAGAAIAAYLNQRSIGLYALSFCLLHTRPADIGWLGRRLRRPGARGQLAFGVAGALLTVTGLALWWPNIINDRFYLSEGVSRRFGADLTPAQILPRGAAYLRQTDVERVFSNINGAGYLLAATRKPLYVDGRTEAYSAALWAEYLSIKRGDETALSLLDARRVQAVSLVLTDRSFMPLARQLLDSARWRLVTAEAAGLVFKRKTLPAGPDRAEQLRLEKRSLLAAAGDGVLVDVSGDRSAAVRAADLALAAANLYDLADRPRDRQRALLAGLARRNDVPVLNHNLGNLLLAAGDPAAALPHFERALAINPHLAGSALNAGVCEIHAGRPAEAAAWFRRSLKLDGDSVPAWANLANALRRDGRPADAISALARAVELAPGDSHLRQRLAEWRAGRN